MPVKTIATILTQAETCRPVFDAAAAIAGEHGAHYHRPAWRGDRPAARAFATRPAGFLRHIKSL